MSYILDALRKADSQRVRNPARGIHALPAATIPALATPSRAPEQAARWAAAVLILIGSAWLWIDWHASEPAPTPPLAPVAVLLPAPAPRPMPTPTPAAAVLPGPPAVALAPVASPPEVRRSAVGTVAPAAPSAIASATVSPAALPVAAERSYSVVDLPADVQQALPKFSISGGVYSDNIAQRMLIVNGQVFSEGSEVAPGVVLEQVRPKTVLLKFRGLRISQPY